MRKKFMERGGEKAKKSERLNIPQTDNSQTTYKNKTRMTTVTNLIQHSAGNPSHGNKTRKR